MVGEGEAKHKSGISQCIAKTKVLEPMKDIEEDGDWVLIKAENTNELWFLFLCLPNANVVTILGDLLNCLEKHNISFMNAMLKQEFRQSRSINIETTI